MNELSTKEKVLAFLKSREGTAVSGKELAEYAGVSGNAVWKAVNTLREAGYNINAKRNLGYALMPSNVLSKEEIGEYLSDPRLCEKLEVFKTVGSTNTLAKQYAAEHGCTEPVEKIFVANEQTAGRGRQGRSFYSPEGTGIYMSFLINPGMNSAEAVRITTASSVAVCMAIEKVFGINPVIKWVNDVYLGDRKICGILTEAVTDFETGMVDSVVIGIGVNVFTEDFPEEIADIAGSLTAMGEADRNRLTAEIINFMTGLCRTENGRLVIGDYIDEYKKRSMVIGKRIKILNTNEVVLAEDIDKSGGLVVRLSDGTTKVLGSGEISIRVTE